MDGSLIEDNVKNILEHIGENPNREGLLDTPKRFIKAFKEMTEGYHQNPKDILSTFFEGDGYDEMVIVKDISFISLCEHHLLPFNGIAHVGYIPKSRVIGLSKIPRLVHCFSRRLQIQERLTRQIATTLEDVLDANGVGVILNAAHQCVSCRGVRQQGSSMTTSALLGRFRNQATRNEFLQLIR